MPVNPYQWLQLSECILAAYLMVRGAFVTIHNLCVWTLVKCGIGEYRDPE
jgi:hypothetical protein